MAAAPSAASAAEPAAAPSAAPAAASAQEVTRRRADGRVRMLQVLCGTPMQRYNRGGGWYWCREADSRRCVMAATAEWRRRMLKRRAQMRAQRASVAAQSQQRGLVAHVMARQVVGTVLAEAVQNVRAEAARAGTRGGSEGEHNEQETATAAREHAVMVAMAAAKAATAAASIGGARVAWHTLEAASAAYDQCRWCRAARLMHSAATRWRECGGDLGEMVAAADRLAERTVAWLADVERVAGRGSGSGPERYDIVPSPYAHSPVGTEDTAPLEGDTKRKARTRRAAKTRARRKGQAPSTRVATHAAVDAASAQARAQAQADVEARAVAAETMVVGRPAIDALLTPTTKARRDEQNEPVSPPPRASSMPDVWRGVNFAPFDAVRPRDGALAVCQTHRQIPSASTVAASCQAERQYLREVLGPILSRIRHLYEEGGDGFDYEHDRHLERALKAKLVITELMLRKSGRGGRGGKRARSEVQQRLGRWSLGDQEALLAEWDGARKRMAADRARDATTRRAESVGGKHDVRQLRGTCAIGAFGRAMRQLHSHGVADATDPAVVEQLRAKHPQRGELCGEDMSVPRPEEYGQPRAHPPSSGDRIVVPLEALKKRMLGAKPSKGQGPDGMYNEHLWMLGREYSEGTREWQVVDDYKFYAELYLNARLPRWALKYSAAARLVALHKQEVRPGRDLKVRPIAVGQVERRALCGVAVDIFADDLAGHLQPFQVACGVPASAERMAYGVRATLERNKDWCCLQVDARNAFNEWYRALIVPELAKSQQLRRLIPFVCALGGPAAPLAFGWQQGTLDASELGEWCAEDTNGPCRFQMAETTCQPQFEPPHHLEWLIRRLSASSIWGRMRFFAGRPVRSWRRVLRFRRAPPGPVLRAFARGWVGSRYRAGKRMGGGLQLGSPRNPLRAGWLPSLPVVGRGDFPQPQKLRPHS